MRQEKRTGRSTSKTGQSKEVSGVPETDVVCLLVADIHLSEKPPIARSAEPDWFRAMNRPLKELRSLQKQYDCPILCAGDLFDKWNPNPSLINWAIDSLPKMYCIPGQHDLKLHSYDDLEKTAYWTLHAAGTIVDLGNARSEVENHTKVKLIVHPFPWGHKVCPNGYEKRKGTLHLALVHEYCWYGKAYKDAPEEANAAYFSKRLDDYDAAAFGDNHSGFLTESYDIPILNCGTFYRRKADEISYRPAVGKLYDNGKIGVHFLDCSQDKFIDLSAACDLVEDALDMTEFLHELRKAGDKGLDFVSSVKRFCQDNNIGRGAVKAILQALESK